MSEQPKEYIITEKQLYGMEYGYRLKTIAKEVRSRPAPSLEPGDSDIEKMLARLDSTNCDGKCDLESALCDYTCKKEINIVAEHDAAIRSKECERLLKKFDTLAETKWFAVDVGDPDGNVCVVSTDDIENLIKSLREGAP